MVQGRAIGASNLRYITIKYDKSYKKIFGCERVNRAKTVLVCEGPFDSLFLYNCLATCDSNLLSCDFGDIFIPDWQMRNKEIVQGYEKIINAGKRVVFWDKFKYNTKKDINDMIIAGATIREIHEYIARNTYTGLQAKLKLAECRRI